MEIGRIRLIALITEVVSDSLLKLSSFASLFYDSYAWQKGHTFEALTWLFPSALSLAWSVTCSYLRYLAISSYEY